MRWGIETSFRELKYCIGIVNLHGKKDDFVKQEIYAALTMYNFCNRISNAVVIEQKHQNMPIEYRHNEQKNMRLLVLPRDPIFLFFQKFLEIHSFARLFKK